MNFNTVCYSAAVYFLSLNLLKNRTIFIVGDIRNYSSRDYTSRNCALFRYSLVKKID